MLLLILSFVLIGIILFSFTFFRRRNEPEEIEVKAPINEDCCGAHEVCEQDSLLSNENKIVYYDDEELDQFANKEPDRYTPTDIIQFSEVFFTLKEADVAGWLRSLQLRNIQLPFLLREEALLIVRERRGM